MLPTMTVSHEPGYLFIKGVGYIRTLEEQQQWSDAVYREVIANNASRVLMDDRLLQFDSTVGDQCNIVQYYIDRYDSMIRSVKAAFLLDASQGEVNRIWELYLHQRGFPWKVFTEFDDATAFLIKD